MASLAQILEPPSYGYAAPDGSLIVPTTKQLFKEFFSRINLFKDRKNWLAFYSWFTASLFAIPFFFFVKDFLTWKLFLVGFVYSMIILGTHGTIYYHRYSTHRAYQFSHPFWRFITKNLVIKIIPEELYVVSHHVHHLISEKPGDPYNAHAGWLYCFLADAIHQPIARNLTEQEYHRVSQMINHTGVKLNTYAQYQKWGSICNPYRTIAYFALNWSFWYGTFYLIGGIPLATAIFASAGFWAFGVRTFNFNGHGGGKDKRKDGVDFNRKDLSINQLWPGLVTGEWHNNHHLYPNGARAGFRLHQLDYAWYYIWFLSKIGAVSSYRDYTNDFYEKYFNPYKQNRLMPPDSNSTLAHSN